jgi:hypothetical protein
MSYQHYGASFAARNGLLRGAKTAWIVSLQPSLAHQERSCHKSHTNELLQRFMIVQCLKNNIHPISIFIPTSKV